MNSMHKCKMYLTCTVPIRGAENNDFKKLLRSSYREFYASFETVDEFNAQVKNIFDTVTIRGAENNDFKKLLRSSYSLFYASFEVLKVRSFKQETLDVFNAQVNDVFDNRIEEPKTTISKRYLEALTVYFTRRISSCCTVSLLKYECIKITLFILLTDIYEMTLYSVIMKSPWCRVELALTVVKLNDGKAIFSCLFDKGINSVKPHFFT